ncbi:Protein of unknown function [Bacillus wiedmannii]|nr:Protein of unknown function [Bacillus wiedmannii]
MAKLLNKGKIMRLDELTFGLEPIF